VEPLPAAVHAPVESGNGEAETVQEPASDGPAIDVSFEQLQKVWPGLFGSLRDVLGARRWAFFREAVPAAVDGNVIVLEVPHGFHLQSLQEDDAVAAIVATRAGDLLGGPVRVKFGLREPVADGTADQTIDMTQLEERPAASTDPTSLLATELGAEVVDE
jgi:hypothetical protein